MHDPTAQVPPAIDPSLGDAELINAISDLLSQQMKQDAMVFHEPTDHPIHLDLHWLSPRKERPYHIVLTSGMASKPMLIPGDEDRKLYVEICTMLPPDWPLPQQEEAAHRTGVPGVWWPFNMIKMVAKFPHMVGAAVGMGHTVQVTDGRSEFSAGVRFSGVILLPAKIVHPSLDVLRVGDREVDFLSVFPLYPEEMDFKLKHGLEGFLTHLEKVQLAVPHLWNPDRVNTCGGPTGAWAGPRPTGAGGTPRGSRRNTRRRWWWPF